MKRISFLMITILMACTMVMAQGRRGGGERQMDPKTHAERMTERMVKEYSLNDEQKQKLYEVNLAMANDMQAERPMNVDKKDKKKDKKKDQDKANKEEREKKWAEMEKSRTAYDAKVKEILTDEQYIKYAKNRAERQERMKERRPRG